MTVNAEFVRADVIAQQHDHIRSVVGDWERLHIFAEEMPVRVVVAPTDDDAPPEAAGRGLRPTSGPSPSSNRYGIEWRQPPSSPGNAPEPVSAEP